jgi:membrane dipeptidase
MKAQSAARLQIIILAALVVLTLPAVAQNRVSIDQKTFDSRIAEIHKKWVFADMHGHPSHIHRDDAKRITDEELSHYRRGLFDIITADATTDNRVQGNYALRDGTYVPPVAPNALGHHILKPGDLTAFALDRIQRVQQTVSDGAAVLATSPAAVLQARQEGKISLLMALEGAEGLEEKVSNVKMFYDKGVRLIQLVHLEPNALGSVQTAPLDTAGLSPLGEQVVKECNRLGIVIDLAHGNRRTVEDALRISTKPIIFSHTASHHVWKGARGLDDDEMKEIANKGGIVGLWVNIQSYPTVKAWGDDVDYVRGVVGIDHLGIGTDLRGLDSTGYMTGFGSDAHFEALERELMERGYSNDDIGKILGGNFFRVWQQVTAASSNG